MRISQSQNVPLSCLSQPLANWLAEAAYRHILGLSYPRALSAEWNTTDRVYTKYFGVKSPSCTSITPLWRPWVFNRVGILFGGEIRVASVRPLLFCSLSSTICYFRIINFLLVILTNNKQNIDYLGD